MAPRRLAASRLCGVCALFLLLSSSGASTLDSICTIPSHPPKRRQSGKDDALVLLNSFQLNFGYFFGGEGIHFAEDGNASYVIRSFSLFPHSVDRTADDSLLHVAATLTLSGGRARSYLPSHHGRRRRYRYVGDHHVRFYLDGYYSYASDELCMTGTGTYSSDGGSIEHLEDVVLKLRIPSPSNLSDPFVTGRLKGASFEAISLVAYAEGFYQYGESASCPTLQPSSPARGAFQALGANFSCAHLKEHLDTSYKLQYGGGGTHAPALMGLHGRQRLHVGQVQCTADGEVRAYAVLYNKTEMRGQLQPHSPFMFEEEVFVAEGRWYSDRSMLCLTACRVERSAETSLSVKECGVGMSFW
ncbi:hypothetical protein PAHAL_5G207400 [Panicum hallii]|jgi:hypothetical protein|uniref:DUF2921 domain-containing protein n=2 Tax=Panicum hallii TaxID=206008 RepID=A0A2S3HT22_9POAL|nr:hypothetical protein PAHAL_5G207400 [Panicum hallii]